MEGNQKMRNSNRVLFLDILRGVAALTVMFEHVIFSFVNSSYLNTGSNIFNLGVFGVLIFFLVSGFVIPFSLERYKSIKFFFISRVFRIYPLYLIIFLIALLLCFFNIIGQWASIKDKLILNLALTIFFLEDYISPRLGSVSLFGGTWTLFIEMIWYILFAYIYIYKLNKKNVSLIVGANSALLLLTIISITTQYRIPPGRPMLLFCCFIGLFIYRYFNNQIKIKSFIIFFSISLVNLYFAMYVGFRFYTNPHFSFSCVAITYTTGFLFFGLCYLFSNSINGWLKSMMVFLGNISFSLYLCHGIVLNLLRPKLSNGYTSCIIVFSTSILVAYLLYVFIEKPGVQIGKKINKKLTIEEN